MPLPLVLLSRPLPDHWLTQLAGQCELIVGTSGIATLPEHFARAEGIFTLLTDRVDDRLLEQLPRLKVVSNMAVGVDNIDVAACTRRKISVGHTPGVLIATLYQW